MKLIKNRSNLMLTSILSLSKLFRNKRSKIFESFMANYTDCSTILDIGGTFEYWKTIKYSREKLSKIILLNLKEEKNISENFKSIIGNATDLSQFKDKEIDIVFSNSVIEHLGTFENQQKMADEVKRIGKVFFIQTPNKFFPIEPHFVFPFFQFLPVSIKVFLLKNFNLGNYKKQIDNDKCIESIKEIRLLDKKELKLLFPDSEIIEEKLFFFTKSFIIHSQ